MQPLRPLPLAAHLEDEWLLGGVMTEGDRSHYFGAARRRGSRRPQVARDLALAKATHGPLHVCSIFH
ncbi:hypothetical protein ACW2AB_02400, partial [Limosilactobacillus fermentum]